MFYVCDCDKHREYSLVADTIDSVTDEVSCSFLYKAATTLNIEGVDVQNQSITQLEVSQIIDRFIFVSNLLGYHSNFVYNEAVLKECLSNGDAEMNIPYGIRYIAADCYKDSYDNVCKLIKLVLPATTVKVGNHAFLRLDFLQEVLLNEGLVELGISCFGNCHCLRSMTLPSTVRKLMTLGSFGSDFTLVIKSQEMIPLTWIRDSFGRRVQAIELGHFANVPTVIVPRNNNYEDYLVAKIGTFNTCAVPNIKYMD